MIQFNPLSGYFESINFAQDNLHVLKAGDTMTGNLGIGVAPSYPLDVNGDVRFGTRLRFSNASGDGGTFAIIGLDSGTGKNLEIYDYAENGTLVRIYGANMSMNVGQWNSTSDPGSKSLGVGGSLYVTSKTGIGTTNPAGLLDVNASLSGTPGLTGPYVAIGASTFTDSNTAASGTATNMAFNSIAAPALAASNTGVKTTNAYTLYIAGPPSSGTNETIANASGLGVAGNVIINPVETGTANSNGSQANTALWIAPTFTGAGTNMRGITVFPNANNIGSGGSFYGVRLTAAVNGTTDSNNNVYAFNGQVTCGNTSTVGTVYGLGLWTPTYNQTSTSSNAVGLQVQAQACTPSNTSTTGGYNTYGINLTIGNQGGNTSGTDTNYGVYIQGSGGTAGAGGTVNNYAIYSTSSAVSYFGGSVGFGTNNPQNQLHISSGSAVGLRIDGTGNTTTSATAGAATLPANPVGFLIVNIGGTSYKLPYYS